MVWLSSEIKFQLTVSLEHPLVKPCPCYLNTALVKGETLFLKFQLSLCFSFSTLLCLSQAFLNGWRNATSSGRHRCLQLGERHTNVILRTSHCFKTLELKCDCRLYSQSIFPLQYFWMWAYLTESALYIVSGSRTTANHITTRVFLRSICRLCIP